MARMAKSSETQHARTIGGDERKRARRRKVVNTRALMEVGVIQNYATIPAALSKQANNHSEHTRVKKSVVTIRTKKRLRKNI